MARIYVASSWRNEQQAAVVQALREAGHQVYDFKNPAPGNTGFGWSQIDLNWRNWPPEQVRQALKHPVAQAGFKLDHDAMAWADTFVMVLPCGRSAHLELGWACGGGKRTIILMPTQQEPELMYLEADYLAFSVPEVLDAVRRDVVSPGWL
jgi:hypothetical protein